MIRVIALVVILVACDFIGIRVAKEIATAKTPATVVERHVDWSKSGRQNCEVRRALVFYRYQICYDVVAWSEDKGSWSASLFFHSPRQVFHWSRLFMSTSYYFTELAYGENLNVIYYAE